MNGNDKPSPSASETPYAPPQTAAGAELGELLLVSRRNGRQVGILLAAVGVLIGPVVWHVLHVPFTNSQEWIASLFMLGVACVALYWALRIGLKSVRLYQHAIVETGLWRRRTFFYRDAASFALRLASAQHDRYQRGAPLLFYFEYAVGQGKSAEYFLAILNPPWEPLRILRAEIAQSVLRRLLGVTASGQWSRDYPLCPSDEGLLVQLQDEVRQLPWAELYSIYLAPSQPSSGRPAPILLDVRRHADGREAYVLPSEEPQSYIVKYAEVSPLPAALELHIQQQDSHYMVLKN